MTTRSTAITTPTPDATIPKISRLCRSRAPMLAMRAEGDSIGVLDPVADDPSLAPRSPAGQAPLLQRRPRCSEQPRPVAHRDNEEPRIVIVELSLIHISEP